MDVLVPADPGAGEWAYDPLEEAPRLFEELVLLDPAPEACAAFASRRGLLGLPGLLVPATRPLFGEPLEAWKVALDLLREAFELWAEISGEDRAHAWSHLRFGPSEVEGKATLEVGEVEFDGPQTHRRWLRGQLCRELDESASHRTSAELVLAYLINRQLKQLTAFDLAYNADTRRLELLAGPTSLLGVAWHQLAEAAAGRHRPRRCAQCERWFVVSGKRGDDTYCGATCRSAMHKRKARARRLAAEGKRPSEIARALDTDSRIVRGWLGEKPRRKGRD